MGATDVDPDGEVDEAAIARRAEHIGAAFARSREDAQSNIKSAQEKQKKAFDLKHSAPDFKVSLLLRVRFDVDSFFSPVFLVLIGLLLKNI